ncbi:leucine-rich repeat-containing protein 69-like [Styela clava]
MADQIVRSLKPGTKHINLNGRKLKAVPKPICLVTNLVVLELKNNFIHDLPNALSRLENLEILNVGGNELEILPEVIKSMTKLTKLHLFKNKIQELNTNVLCQLTSLVFLNLNDNQIKEIPPEIERLEKLEVISLNHNCLVTLCSEICFLPNLREIHATHNSLSTLPLELGFLENLEKLHLSRNKIKELPEGLGKLRKLRLLDVAANELRIFPTELSNVPLKELYCEANPLLECIAVHSVQEEEILSLKELVARFIMKNIKDKSSILRHEIRDFPAAREMLSQASKCAVCSDAFLNTWLECVKFISTSSEKEIKIRKCSQHVIPVRALLCSYKCFNTPGHGYYGVAFP